MTTRITKALAKQIAEAATKKAFQHHITELYDRSRTVEEALFDDLFNAEIVEAVLEIERKVGRKVVDRHGAVKIGNGYAYVRNNGSDEKFNLVQNCTGIDINSLDVLSFQMDAPKVSKFSDEWTIRLSQENTPVLMGYGSVKNFAKLIADRTRIAEECFDFYENVLGVTLAAKTYKGLEGLSKPLYDIAVALCPETSKGKGLVPIDTIRNIEALLQGQSKAAA